MKVLIIDDENGVLEMYKEYFKQAKIEYLTASDGQNGINLAKAQKPDVILLDIIMPKINGLDVLKKFKEDEDLKNIPVYLLTNLPKESSSQKAKELGAAGYMVKAENDPKTVIDIIKGSQKENL